MTTDETILQVILSLITSGFKRVHQKDSYRDLNKARQGLPEYLPPRQEISASD